MRSSTANQNPIASAAEQNANHAIDSSAQLSITINIESKARKSTIYRAVQRADGVIVERPRYRPSISTPPTFQPQIPTFQPSTTPTSKHRKLSQSRIRRMDQDLRGIRTFDEELRFVECGRDGYNSPREYVMRRFLDEPGPWTPYALGARTIQVAP